MTGRFEEIVSHESEAVAEMKRVGFSMDAAISTRAVNRTHRAVRERARMLQDRKKRVRALWIPLAVSFGMLTLILVAVWNLLDETEFFSDGIPDSSQQMLMLSMWCLPLSVIVLAVIWFRRARTSDRSPR